MLEADLLGVFGLAEYRQGQLGRLREHGHRANGHFDLAGGKARVDGGSIARHHLAVDANDAFGAQPVEDLEAGAPGWATSWVRP